MRAHLAPSAWQTQPLSSHACPLDELAPEPQEVPKLLAAHFQLGARICGPPALDREFRTIDFLTFLDLQSLPIRATARYRASNLGRGPEFSTAE